jgi:dihydrofolate reductase
MYYAEIVHCHIRIFWECKNFFYEEELLSFYHLKFKSKKLRMKKFDVVLYIATSSDGFIADENGSVDWLNSFNTCGDDSGYNEFFKAIDVIASGRKTYEQILSFDCEWPYPGKKTYVLTGDTNMTSSRDDVFFVQSLSQFLKIMSEQEQEKVTVWLMGGSKLIESFSETDLIDRVIETIIPVAINQGIKFAFKQDDFRLVETKNFSNGIHQNIFYRKS